MSSPMHPTAGWERAPGGAVWLCPGCGGEVRPQYRGTRHTGYRVKCPDCGASEYAPPTAGRPWEGGA